MALLKSYTEYYKRGELSLKEYWEWRIDSRIRVNLLSRSPMINREGAINIDKLLQSYEINKSLYYNKQISLEERVKRDAIAEVEKTKADLTRIEHESLERLEAKRKENEWTDTDQTILSTNRYLGNKATAYAWEIDKHERQQYRESGDYGKEKKEISNQFKNYEYMRTKLDFYPDGNLNIEKYIRDQVF